MIEGQLIFSSDLILHFFIGTIDNGRPKIRRLC